jgi:hypothetical protein
MSALASAVLLLAPASAVAADAQMAPSRAPSAAVGADHQGTSAATAATICYWLPRLPGCPIKKG